MVDPLYAGAAFAVGLLFGPFAETTLANLLPDRYARSLIVPNVKRALSRTSAGWTLHEKEGRRYVWQPIDEGDEPDQLVTSDDRMFEDVGLMGHLSIGDNTRIAFGCTFDSHRVITSPLVAASPRSTGS
jgi:hypothetical protein